MTLSTEQRDWLTLALVPGIGSTHFVRLLARFRTPTEVLHAGERALAEVVRPTLARQITQYAEVVDVPDQERRMAECGATLVTLDDTAYPWRLGEIYDPPLALFVRGSLLAEDEHAVAIVGTRRPTPYGLRMAEKLARELAVRGITVVSGLASGVDSAAHRGALGAGGRTIAVLGNGVDVVYPREHGELTSEIIAHGCVISQFPMGYQPNKGHFPRRNRIISGMTLGTVVVQAPRDSGALITAHAAVEQGREVFAVPGEAGVRASEGPHGLIREGAKLVESAEDIIVELNLPAIQRQPVPQRTEMATPQAPSRPVAVSASAAGTAPAAQRVGAPQPVVSDTEREVLSVLTADGSFVDEIAAACRVSIAEALSTLTYLELKGLVRQFSGKRFAPR
jgi:DNA processing protein